MPVMSQAKPKPQQIERNDEPYQRDEHRRATQALIEYWNKNQDVGFKEISEDPETPEWSRSHYRNMYQRYTQPATDSPPDRNPLRVDLPDDPLEAYLEGYRRAKGKYSP